PAHHFLPRTVAFAAGLLLALPGCAAGPRLYPVEGVVQCEDGSPARQLAGGTGSLESVADKSNASGRARGGGPALRTHPPRAGRAPPGPPAASCRPRGGARPAATRLSTRATGATRPPGSK